MPQASRVRVTLVGAIVAVIAMHAGWAQAQPTTTQPNPYQTVENWAKMPEGRPWGSTNIAQLVSG
jgi:hypothetical protein